MEAANFETAQEVCSKSGSDTFFSKREEEILNRLNIKYNLIEL